MTAKSFDPKWEEAYAGGHKVNYPWDVVVTFVFRNAGAYGERRDVSILEVGCGTGANLWFAAREGFNVAGCDASESAVAATKERLERDGLSGDVQVADFTKLPFDSDRFELAIDRCSIACCSFADGKSAVAEVFRCLKPGGRFLFNGYTTQHTSAGAGSNGPDGLRFDIDRGTLKGLGQGCFYSDSQLDRALDDQWLIISRRTLSEVDKSVSPPETASEFRLVLEKPSDRVGLRPATSTDAEMIFDWRNNDEIINQGIDSRPVTWEEHTEWFNAKLESDDNRIFVIRHRDEDVGVLRFDGRSPSVVSIYLTPGQAGKGIGATALLMGCRLVRDDLSPGQIIAVVRADNPRAQRAFLKAGFVPDKQASEQFESPASVTFVRSRANEDERR